MLSRMVVAGPVLLLHDTLTTITGGVVETPVGAPTPGPASPVPTGGSGSPVPSGGSASPAPSVASAPPDPTVGPLASPAPGEPAWVDGGTLDILLVGADAGREGHDSYLTDTLILIRFDEATDRVAFITLPRDTQGLPIPPDWPAAAAYGGLYPGKVNTIYTEAARYRPELYPGDARNKGYEALKGMLGELYGVDVDYFVALDLQSFQQVVDALGGVVVDVQTPVQGDHYSQPDGDGHLKLYIPPGIQGMDGPSALAYARARHGTSDFDRSLRQQRVVTEMRQQLDPFALLEPGRITSLLETAKASVRTDFPPDRLPQLMELMEGIDLDERISLSLNPPVYSQVCFPCPPDGLYALRADVGRIRDAVRTVFTEDPAARERREQLAAEGAVVHVRNGTPSNNLKTSRVADALAAAGLDASVPDDGGAADRTDHPDTVIAVRPDRLDELPVTVALLEELLGVPAVATTDAEQVPDVLVIVGAATPDLRP
jgi:LCP family protein required for cell wall assembly